MFAIAWQYLSGRVTAKEVDDHQKVEWPPHPDRVFQALVAAWGERACDPQERAALEWLEGQEAPRLSAPEIGGDDLKRAVTQVFVPVNDVDSRGKDGCRVLPEMRPRKDRTFASLHIGEETICALVWPDADPTPAARAALEGVCAAVTHVGHSRSLVRMWVTSTPPAPVWQPAPQNSRYRSDCKLRIPHAGRLRRLEEAHRALVEGRLARNAWPTSMWRDYVRVAPQTDHPHSPWQTQLIVLRISAGQGAPGLVQAPAFVRAMRAKLIKAADRQPLAMPWVSGHATDSQFLTLPHVAVLPLPHVGHEHADGHLLGLALAMPREIPADDEQSVYATLAEALGDGHARLWAGASGEIQLQEEERSIYTRPQALRPETWCRHAACWGSVTPIVLDRMPPRRHRDLDAWAAEQIATACRRQGLPQPETIAILPVSPHAGAPACREFPPLNRKPDGATRWHVHARIQFASPVAGPLILGAGRYHGYGLCKPLSPAKRDASFAPNAESISRLAGGAPC
jgi:CRISPR-associated protein Csb2